MNKRLVLWAITSALAGLLFGFDTVVISGAESKIQQLWSLSGTMQAISAALWGTVLGAIFGGIPTEDPLLYSLRHATPPACLFAAPKAQHSTLHGTRAQHSTLRGYRAQRSVLRDPRNATRPEGRAHNDQRGSLSLRPGAIQTGLDRQCRHGAQSERHPQSG